MNDYSWLSKKTPRSVEQLKLWAENPRLNPESLHLRISDYVDDLISDDTEKDAFLDLLKSITKDGFRPYDPIIIWKQDDGHYYVAEGNRRILALKLLLEPDKAPKSIRQIIKKLAQNISSNDIKKVMVNVAPDFEEAEWYINQRHSAAGLRRQWTRAQQQRWILELYDKYSGDITIVSAKTNFTASQLENYIRPLKIRDLVFNPLIKKHLTEDEIAEAKSIKFPITILERFFSNPMGREKFRLEYSGMDIIIDADMDSFFVAFADLIEKIIKRDTTYKNSPTKIDTRTITSNFQAILNTIPEVLPPNTEIPDSEPSVEPDIEEEENIPEQEPEPSPPPPLPPPTLKNNPYRPYVVLSIYSLHPSNSRLLGLFNEFKKIPPARYPNTIAVSMRVFLDLSVLEYIEKNNLKIKIAEKYKAPFREVPLKKRLEYLKTTTKNQVVKNKIGTLLKSDQQFSLDVLNGFIHGKDTFYVDQVFLNKFWDFLFPIFEDILDIRE